MPEIFNTTLETASPKKKRSKIVTVMAWMVLCMLVPTCGAWVIGRWIYWFDIAASHQMLISWVAVTTTLLLLATRRWIPILLCLCFVCLSFWPVVTGRAWSLPGVALEDQTQGTLRVISYNIHPKNDEWETDFELLLQYDADVIALIECPWGLFRAINKLGYLDSTPYQFWTYRKLVDGKFSRCLLLSKWPMTRLREPAGMLNSEQYLHAQVESSFGSFIVGITHPVSPRTQQRWIQGNMKATSQANRAREIFQTKNIPVFICSDLNSGPAQTKGRSFQNTGLRMSKPLLYMNASYPTNRPMPKFLRVQLDDIWSLGDVSPTSWDMVELSGSDHAAVVADFKTHQ